MELKLAFDPADTARLASHPALEASLVPPEEHELVSTYFDTPDCALHKAGVYLRIRESAGRYVQTVKSAKSKTELLERFEWEREISSRTHDLDGVEGTPLQPLLTPKVRASLQPMFETRIRRNIHRVERDGSEIEVAIDRGEIATRTHTRPVCELELELKRGKTKELFGLARILAETVPLRLEVKTKAERGYELLEDGALKAEKAAEIDIAPKMTAGEAFRAIALSCLRQIVANEPAMCAGQAEALHQMRIGLRRLRAAIAIFADVVGDAEVERIKAELKWITRELGPARDLDVFAADVLAPLRASHPEDDGIAATHRDFEERRAAAYASAAGSVRSDRFRTAMLDLAEWVETGPWAVDNDKERKALRPRAIAKHAKKELGRLRTRIKRKGADLRHRSVCQRHRLRIRAKRLRYGTEFFASTFPGEASAKCRVESLSALKDLQDALGGLNDLATRHALEDDARETEKSAPATRLAAAGTQAETLLLKAEQAFARFAGTKPFWKA
ncbi:MAG: CHAD domain-containing protein [Methyloceanibacter sp.]|nr:CHAD domain-containing protein [Methyloceanibacter sp.]